MCIFQLVADQIELDNICNLAVSTVIALCKFSGKSPLEDIAKDVKLLRVADEALSRIIFRCRCRNQDRAAEHPEEADLESEQADKDGNHFRPDYKASDPPDYSFFTDGEVVAQVSTGEIQAMEKATVSLHKILRKHTPKLERG